MAGTGSCDEDGLRGGEGADPGEDEAEDAPDEGEGDGPEVGGASAAGPPPNRLCAGGTGCRPNPGVRIGVRLPPEAEAGAGCSGGVASGRRRFGTVGPSGETGFRASGGTGGGGVGVGAPARRDAADEVTGGGVRVEARGRSA